jgi:hypothetical protein
MNKLNTVQNGKGSKPRPVNDLEKFNDNWDFIFSKKDKKDLAKETEKCETSQYENNDSNSL